MINRIEAIIWAIAKLNNFLDPSSPAFRLNNPLLLKSYSAPGKHQVDENGFRIFDSGLGGVKAAYFDIELKLSGKSNTGLQPTDKLKNLLAVFGLQKEEDIMSIIYFLRKAVDKNIDSNTSLSFFLEQ